MHKKIYFIVSLLFTGMLTLNAQQLAVSFSRTYNPALPLYGFNIIGRRVPVTRNLTSADCLINTSTQKAVVESAVTSNGIFTAKILLTTNGQNALRWTFSLQSGANGDYNYVTYITVDNLLTKTGMGSYSWNGSVGKAMELVGMVAGFLDMFYDTPLVYAENPAAEKKRLADAAAAEKKRLADAVAEEQRREEAQKTEITPEEEFKFELTEDSKGVSISKYTGSRKYVSIPAEIQGFPVTRLGSRAFYNNETIVSVTIADGVKEIGSNAFEGCDNLVSVTIPDSVTSIGDKAFEDATSLTSVKLPVGLKEVPVGMFLGCTALKSITIPMGVTVIKDIAFSGTGLTSITIPDSVTGIGNGVFRGDKSLMSVKLPSGLKEVPENMFKDCTALKSITIPMGVTVINKSVFSGTGLTSITIPDSVTGIGNGVFSGCSALTTVTIPDSVKTIDGGNDAYGEKTLYEWAFSECGKLSLMVQVRLKEITVVSYQKEREKLEQAQKQRAEEEQRAAQAKLMAEATRTVSAFKTKFAAFPGRDRGMDRKQFAEFMDVYEEYIASGLENVDTSGWGYSGESQDFDRRLTNLKDEIWRCMGGMNDRQKKTFSARFNGFNY
jgi:hypothetical protein